MLGEDFLTIRRVNPLDDPSWDTTVARFPGATFFHSAAWARVLQDTYQFRPSCFLATDTENQPAAIVPFMEVNSWLTGRRGVSLPFTDECEPLLAAGVHSQPITDAISRHALERRWKYWEVRGGAAAFAAPASVAFHGHRLDLREQLPALFAAFDGATRRAVRKAEQARLSINFSHDTGAVRAFHALLCQTRKRHGLPPQPLRFFENIQRHILAPGKGCIALVRLDDTPVAGAVFLHFARSAVFKFGASDAAFQHLRPNNLVMWRAIEWHARAGFESLDFGRTSLGNEGLRRFKLGWGAHERRIEYVRLDCRTAAFVTTHDRSSGWHNRFFALLPSRVARLVGAAAYKHVA